MQVHLLDATYELFRAHFGRRRTRRRTGGRSAPRSGVVESALSLLREDGVTHLGCASDHVIHSWRNERFAGYKTDAGMPRELLAQFGPAEDALRAIGVVVWPMVEFEADDALGAAAARWADDPDVERVVIMTPDKDMAQCVREDGTVVTYDRRKRTLHGRRRRRREVRRVAGLDPRLPRAGRRLRRRLPGPPRLGRPLGRRRAVALPAPRGHPRLGRRRWDVSRARRGHPRR